MSKSRNRRGTGPRVGARRLFPELGEVLIAPNMMAVLHAGTFREMSR